MRPPRRASKAWPRCKICIARRGTASASRCHATASIAVSGPGLGPGSAPTTTTSPLYSPSGTGSKLREVADSAAARRPPRPPGAPTTATVMIRNRLNAPTLLRSPLVCQQSNPPWRFQRAPGCGVGQGLNPRCNTSRRVLTSCNPISTCSSVWQQLERKYRFSFYGSIPLTCETKARRSRSTPVVDQQK